MNTQLNAIRLTLRVFLAHYTQAPLQAGAILLGIILAVTLLTGVRATNESAIKSYSHNNELLGSQIHWLITPKATPSLDEQVYLDLKRLGLDQSLAVVEGTVEDEQQRRWQMMGIDLIAALQGRRFATKSNLPDKASSFNPFFLPLGQMLSGKNIALISQTQANILGKNSLQLADTRIELIPVADNFHLGDRLLMDISAAQPLLNQTGKLSYIALFGDLEGQLTPLRAWLSDRGQLIANDSGDGMKALTSSFHLNLTAMSLLAFIVGFFIAYNGVRYSLLKRKRLLTQLQQQGVMKPSLLLALILELLLLVLIGSLMGFILGLQLSLWLQPLVNVTLEQLYGATISTSQWRWQWLLQAALLTFAATVLACGSLFREIMRQPLAQSTGQYSVQVNARITQKWQLFTSLLLAAIAAVFMPFSRDYHLTMALLGLVVVSIPLALPWLLQRLVNFLSTLTRGGLLGYQVAETKELIAPLSLAMMAILLALSANIAMNSLVGSFEITLKQWLDARLHAQLYLRPPQEKIVAIADYLSNDSQVSDLYQQWKITTQYRQVPTQLLTRDRESIEQTSILKQAHDELWPHFFNQAGKQRQWVLVSEPFAIKNSLALNDTFTLPRLNGFELQIAGIYFDYGNPYGEVMIAPELWRASGLSSVPLSLGLNYRGNIGTYSQQLAAQFSLSPTLIFSQEKIKSQAIAMFTHTFAITKVLNSLTLLVAAIGLFSACYMLTQNRLAAIARLYCLGVNRRQLSLMALSQMLLIVLLTCVIALPTGALLGYLLIHKVTLQAFGWTIPMVWNWLAYFEVILLALCISTLAVAMPLYIQTRRPLIGSLQSEVL
ncbi:ABC transporter permease [Shewanella sp. AS1]|uniref:ABC transporter permease n=1 Tax=Shewanella sp. AS1 TaxID=2907626 RepID=UPI001F38C8C8|nr:ABC transporter permease [Shewanella sp. AS1]MCE9679298.1 ABC transporter permease [Shewanella sp. AS1]